MSGPVPALADRATACADRLRESDEVLLASHIDADGLTSAAIAATALERAAIPFTVVFSKQLNDEEIEAMGQADVETVLFTDFGSGQLESIVEQADAGRFTPIVCDHHEPADADTPFHLNPHLFGIDGSRELSGAGAAYVLARALENGTDNRDLAALAVVGAVGDMQASDGELSGANEGIVAEAVEAGVLDTGTDLTFYGTQTRPIPKLIEYAGDIRIPGITNNPSGVQRFLEELDIELQEGEEWRSWVELTRDEQRQIVSGLIRRAVASGVPTSRIETMTGTTYTLTQEDPGTELRDASEFSTLLNATARYERADVGLGVCLGDRGQVLSRARRLLANHRRNLSEGISWVQSRGVTVESNLQWFDAGDRIPDTIVGIVAGMAMGVDGVRADRPIIAFAEESPTDTKVSSRGTGRLVGDGLDLSTVMHDAAVEVGGDGGGHTIAAGATIPSGAEERFLELANEIIAEQLA